MDKDIKDDLRNGCASLVQLVVMLQASVRKMLEISFIADKALCSKMLK